MLDGNAVAEGIAAIYSETASMLKYNDENSLTCTILMAYYSAKAYYMDPVLEMPSGKGFADVVYLSRRKWKTGCGTQMLHYSSFLFCSLVLATFRYFQSRPSIKTAARMIFIHPCSSFLQNKIILF